MTMTTLIEDKLQEFSRYVYGDRVNNPYEWAHWLFNDGYQFTNKTTAANILHAHGTLDAVVTVIAFYRKNYSDIPSTNALADPIWLANELYLILGNVVLTYLVDTLNLQAFMDSDEWERMDNEERAEYVQREIIIWFDYDRPDLATVIASRLSK